MEIKNRQKLLMIGAAAALALWVLDSVAIEPLIAKWKSRSEQLVELEKRVTLANGLVRNEAGIRRTWNGKKDNMLPAGTAPAEAEMLKAFDRWQRSSGITLASYRAQWRQGQDDTYTTLECHADISGSLRNITEFLYQMEKDPMAIQLENMQLASRDNNGRDLTLTLQVSGLQLVPPPATNSMTQLP